MPAIASGGTATFTVAAGDYVRVTTGPNGFATLEAVGSPGLTSGEKRWTRINGRQVFGPWQAGTVRINALADSVDYEFGAQVNTDDADRPALWSDASGSGIRRPDGGLSRFVDPSAGSQSFDFAKTSTPLFVSTNGTYSTMFQWSVVSTAGLSSPLGRFYAYYGTDHDPGAGGIAMAYADSLNGPWINYGTVLTDSTRTTSPGTQQAEGPAVVRQRDGTFRMFYQIIAATVGGVNAQGIQSTISATSTDGINWTFDNVFLLDAPTFTRSAGNGHTGYFRPFPYNNGLYAYSLMGSGDHPHMVLNVSDGNPSRWTTDPRLLGYHINRCALGDAVTRYLLYIYSFVVRKNGAPYFVAVLSDFVSGGVPSNRRIAVARASADLRAPVENFVQVWSPTLSWESGDLVSVDPYYDGSTLNVFYVCKTAGVYYVGRLTHEL